MSKILIFRFQNSSPPSVFQPHIKLILGKKNKLYTKIFRAFINFKIVFNQTEQNFKYSPEIIFAFIILYFFQDLSCMDNIGIKSKGIKCSTK